MKLHFLPLLAVSLLFGSIANAQVIISEIHYHPVEEEAFLADGTPVLDLTDDVHEFVEIQNVGASAVNIGGWELTNAAEFTFPANTTIPAGGFRVIAKNPSRLTTVYALPAGSVLGPFTGKLGNDDDTVQLKNAGGSTVDSVAYSARFPWAQTADSLGAGQDWTGINPVPYQYKGRSLQRVSTSASSNDPANWLASPLSPGPTPGGPQAVTRVIPKPVVINLSVEQATDGAPLIRSNSPARITCTFSSTASLSNVSVQYFLDDINLTNETRFSVAMTALGNGDFTVDLPVQANRAMVRYRIRADRGDGVEVVSPRADDPAVVPVAGGAREAWHAYFVTPVRISTKPIYDCFISNASLTILSNNINQGPSRRATPEGFPRDEVWLRPTDPQWNGTQPAIMVFNGVVYDIQMRHHGSRYRRSTSRSSFKWQFPRNNLFLGNVQGIFETDKNVDTGNNRHTEWGHQLHRLAGIPTSYTQRTDLYLNGNALLERLEQSEDDERLLEVYYAEQHRRDPSQPLLEPGEIYKAQGTDEGGFAPYRTSYGETLSPRGGPTVASPSGKILPGGVWTALDQYSYNYTIQGHNWKGHKQFKEMIDAFNAARLAGSAALRTYLNANWDVDKTLTYIALRNWGCPWDDHFHNYYLYRQANGKWMMMPWDFDYEYSDKSFGTSVYTTTGNYFKDAFINTAFNTEFKQKMFTLNNTLLTDANLRSLGINWGQWQIDRFNSVNTQLGLGTFFRPTKPVNQAPANGATALPPAMLTGSTYGHTGGTIIGVRAHTKSKWELREAGGTWDAPFHVVTSTSNLTSLPIPFDKIKWGVTYFWRVTYYDFQDHPSVVSDETQFTFGPTPTPTTLIPMDATTVWKYNATNQFLDQAWTDPAYDDSAWSQGVAVFGQTLTPAILTALNPPQALRTTIPLNNRMTFYFRKHFTFPSSVNGATLKVTQIIDDGVVIHLNGHEVKRVGMPTVAPIDYNTPATRAVGSYVYESGIDIPTTWLLPGDNVLAVEVHQNVSNSNDIIMGMQLDGSYLAQGETVALNEVCADNRSIVSNGGQQPDYIELFNNTAAAIDLGGWALTDDVLVPNKYLFPAGTLIPAQGYLIVWADSDSSAPGLHTGFALNAGGQTVVLTQSGVVRDAVTFGPLPPDLAIGHPIDGIGGWLLVAASPNAPNVPKTLGSAATLKVNEWMVDPTSGDDWFEIYNPDPNPVSLTGLWLSDTPGTPMITQVPALSFIAGRGFTRFEADGKTRGFNSVNFKLAAGGESIVLTDTNGATTINSVSFGIQAQGVSEGRLPDGAAAVASFPSTASPAASNWLPLTSVVINEALSASPPPLEDIIELFNPTGVSVDISGWWLSDSPSDFRKYQIPAGTILAPGSPFRVFNEHDFNSGAPGSFALDGIGGDSIFLSQADAGGNLTGYRLQVDFDAAEAGTSFGRIVTAAGDDFAPLTAFTPDAANAPPKVGPVIINEIMYHPPDLPGLIDDTVDEFIELQNITPHSVPLFDPANPANSWKLRSAISFSFPPNASIPPGSCALVVSFNPANSAQLSAFKTKYNVATGVRVFGPWSGKLANDGDRIELLKPLTPINATVPYALVDKVVYDDATPWPPSGSSTGPDGFGQSIQRLVRSAFGNDPANWTGAAPTAGLDNPSQSPLTFLADNDGDGVPDYWEDENGFDKNDPLDAALDIDGDGQMGLQEFIAGTDPHDAASALTAAVTNVAGGFQIRFTAMPDRSYSVLSCDDLLGGTWTKLSDVPAGAISRVVEVLDLTTVPQRFYKVIAPAQP